MQALMLFQQAVEEGHFKQQCWEGQAVQRAEVGAFLLLSRNVSDC